MSTAVIEHVNYTVPDSRQTADLLSKLFDWNIRWEGASLNGGHTVHVGTDDQYIALYTPKEALRDPVDNYHVRNALNHIGIVVEDLNAMEDRVQKAGFVTFNHQDYEPGKRFYFYDGNGLEFEIVSYSA